ncbi:MAG TPA: hypothetical protein VFG20_05715 [Planctomycetaceae bacterium]|nr:hypothetical protein [Planctomycetaceae bacterium]
MKNTVALCLIAVAAVFGVNTNVADAAAANNNYALYVVSSTSGDFAAIISFDANTFVLAAEDGSLGGGVFVDLGPFTFGTGVGDGYIGSFFAFSGPGSILGIGTGSAGDVFGFFGI